MKMIKIIWAERVARIFQFLQSGLFSGSGFRFSVRVRIRAEMVSSSSHLSIMFSRIGKI